MLTSTWYIFMGLGLIFMMPSLFRLYQNWRQMGMLDVALLSLAALFLFIVGASASQLDEMNSVGTIVTYQNQWWLGYLFYGIALVDFFMVWISAIIPIGSYVSRKKKGY